MSKKNENQNEVSAQHGPGNAPRESHAPQNQSATPPELASLIQVREILTGPLASDMDERIADVEKRLDRSFKEFRLTSSKQFDETERGYKEQMGKLREELGEQKGQYDERVERLDRELSRGLEQMRGSIKETKEDLVKNNENYRTEITKELEAIRGSIQELFEKVSVNIEEQKHRLREELVDRDTLSSAFSEVAIRLAQPAGDAHEFDPSQPDVEIDQILDGATPG